MEFLSAPISPLPLTPEHDDNVLDFEPDSPIENSTNVFSTVNEIITEAPMIPKEHRFNKFKNENSTNVFATVPNAKGLDLTPVNEIITEAPMKKIIPKEHRFNTLKTEKRTFEDEGNFSRNDHLYKRLRTHSVPQFFEHENVTGVLCIKGLSYSITNGVNSISVDENPYWKIEVRKHLNELKIGRLFVTDLDTKIRMKQVSKKEVTLLSNLGPVGNCMFCHNEACCRWIVVHAFQKIFKTKLEAIRH